jgi:mono/diheme cytochrome c family protein
MRWTEVIWGAAAAALATAAIAVAPVDAHRADGQGIGVAGPANKPVVDATKAAAGKQTFVQNCAFCHGLDATGGERGGDLVRSLVVARDRQGEEIGKIVSAGIPAKGMPPFTLSPSQIEDVANFLHQRVAEKASRNAKPINIVVGDPAAGETYFNGAGGCRSCHSPTGDLAHVATKYQPQDLQLRMLFPPRPFPGMPMEMGQRPPVPTEVTVTTPGGEQVHGVLVRLDDFTVALRDASDSYRSWTRTPALKVDVQDPRAAHYALLDTLTDRDIQNLVAYLETLK